MSTSSEFDAFYERARRPLLRYALALTPDVDRAAALTADTFAGAWARWDHVRHSGDPEAWVRRRLHRRSARAGGAVAGTGPVTTATDTSPEIAVLQGLGQLPVEPRVAWALVDVAGLDPELAAAETQRAVAQVAVDAEEVRRALDHPSPPPQPPGDRGTVGDRGTGPLDAVAVLDDIARRVALPPPADLRARRRRAVTWTRGAVPVVVTVSLAALLGGLLVSAGGGELDPGADAPASGATDVGTGGYVPPGVLLDDTALSSLGTGGWEATSTSTALTDSGPGSVCEDAAGTEALGVQRRRFRSASAEAEETVVVHADAERAAAAHGRSVGLWTGCTGVPLLLEEAYALDGVGDDSVVMSLRDWSDPTASYSVALALAGSTTVSLVSADPVAGVPADGPQEPGSPQESADALAAALVTACRQRSTACGDSPVPDGSSPVALVPTTPPAPVGSRGLLLPVDLPPPGDVSEPWAATDPADLDGERPSGEEAASATPCDEVSLSATGAVSATSRSFVMPGDPALPRYFGLAETVATYATPGEAAEVVDTVVRRLATCPRRLPGARVADLDRDLADEGARADGPELETASWGLSFDVSRTERIFVRTAVARHGSSVARLTFTPGPGSDLTRAQLSTLLDRARARLGVDAPTTP